MTRLAFMGSKALGLQVFRQITATVTAPHQIIGAVCPDDRSDSRTELESFRALADAGHIPFEVVRTRSQTEELLQAWRPDIVIVCGWYQLIRLELFPFCSFFGFHASLLPRYRGNAPLVWQIIAGEREVGISFFQFVPAMDAGDIVAQVAIPLAETESIREAIERVASSASEMITRHLNPLLSGTAVLRSQDEARASYCALRIPEDGLIDWSWSARRVHDFVRAQTRPYPGAFTHLPDGRRVRIWRTEIDPRSYVGAPGAVAERAESDVVVTCGEGAVRIVETATEDDGACAPSRILDSLRLRLR